MYIKNYIKIPHLNGGYLYKIIARNANYGIWIPERKSFVISRVKFGSNYLFEEYHYDCEAFATAQPIMEIAKSPFDTEDIVVEEVNWYDKIFLAYRNEKQILEYLNRFEGAKKGGKR